jgi:2-keto-4-pentenoate hydratase/2-oxohepta-3-ene-1,7-dioic acid hydratase in catechol pathway
VKLYTFEVRTQLGTFQRVGIQQGNLLLDANFAVASLLRKEHGDNAYALANVLAPPTMLELLERGDKVLSLLRDVVQQPGSFKDVDGRKITYQMEEVRLLSPLPRPRCILDFSTIEKHQIGGRKPLPPPEWYKIPCCYKGNPGAVIGPDEPIHWPHYTEKLDYELELCAILGRKGRNISEKEAEEYIFGYSILNDFSARDIQAREKSVGMGSFKAKDFGTGIGPCIVTRDDFKPTQAKMIARINGEVWSEGDLRDMHFTFPQLVSYTSDEQYVYPGDVIASGTIAGGCGLELDRWIQPGDIIELEVEGIGILRNTVIRD